MSDSDSDRELQGFDDAEDAGQWWEKEDMEAAKKGERRWETLKHNGVLFPPPYEPHGIPILYEGKEFALTPEEEEIVTMFAALREHDYYKQDVFRNNFFESWQAILKKRGTHPIRRLEYCDFDRIYEHCQREKEKRAAMTREDKAKLKAERTKMEAPHLYALWNGKKEKVANFRVEPPGLFRGRGDHPLRGKLKARVSPEDVVINITEGETPPPPPPGHHWKEVVHNHNVTWLAMWENALTGNNKYVMLAAESSVKGLSDRAKFERARELKNHIEKIRAEYRTWFTSKELEKREMAVAIYFIDRLALRVGNEKKEDEAETVGCCSLQCGHITLEENNRLHFHFLGKDSILYDNTVEVDPAVYKIVKELKNKPSPYSDLFSIVGPAHLNTHFKNYMPDLTAKVFRTYNASKTLQEYFVREPWNPKWSVDEKLAYFTKANTEVAILCNHQKAVSKQQIKTLNAMAGRIGHMKATLDRLNAAQAAGGTLKAMEKFYAEQDAEQYAWLEKYGTPEEKTAYDEYVANRVISSDSARPAKSKSSSSGSPRVKREKKERTVDDIKEEDDEDDVPLALLAPVAKKGGSKRGVKKEEEEDDTKAEASSDDDVPLTEQPAKRSRAESKKSEKAAPASSKKAVKKAAKKADKKAAKKADKKKAKSAAKKADSPAKKKAAASGSKKDDKKSKSKAAAATAAKKKKK